jgi:hypothetical protein
MSRIDELLKKRKVVETVVRVIEIVDDDDVDNEKMKEELKSELSELDTRVAMLEQQLDLMRRA